MFKTRRPRIDFENLEQRSLLTTLSIGDVQIIEQDSGTTTAEFSVSLSESSAEAVTVEYSTSDDTAASLGTIRVASGLTRPLFATAPANDPNRLFIVENGGAIKILDLNSRSILPTPLLTVPDLGSAGEQGLLGLAFHPNFSNNGVFFTSQVRPIDGSIVSQLSRWQMGGDPLTSNTAQADSEDVVLSFEQPFPDHNGGWIGFGPDGFLYYTTGDGGGGYDPLNNSQQLDRLIGKLLRIDVNVDDFPGDPSRDYGIPSGNPFDADGDPATRPEIWAYGFRNPWRNSFDRATGNLYLADVGQRDREEINVQLASSQGGENYGWRIREGTIATPTVSGPGLSSADRIDPMFEYPHLNRPEHGQAITGGYVYNGPLDGLQGHYFFADFITAELWSLRFDGSSPETHKGTNYTELRSRTADLAPDVGSIGFVSSFGEDAAGNLYIIDLVGGEVFLLDPLADYQAESGTLSFAPNETVRTISVQVFGDTRSEGDERFFVDLTNATNATIDDGQAVGTITRVVNLPNQPPVLAPIGGKTVSSTDSSGIALAATDPNGDPLTFSIEVEQQVNPVAELQLELYDARYDNWGGRQEKWLRTGSFKWFFLLPNGELRSWNGDNPPTGDLIADLPSAVFADPGALINATPNLSLPTITLQPHGPTAADLLVRPNGYQGNARVTVTVSDRRGVEDSETFTLDFEPNSSAAPVVTSPVEDFTVSVDTASTEIELFPVFDDADQPDAELQLSVSSNTNPDLVATSIDSNGRLLLAYSGSQAGFADLTIRAADADQFFAADTFRVTRATLNNPPVLAPIGNVSLNPLETTIVPLSAVDAEGQAISFEIHVDSEAYLLSQRLAMDEYTPQFDNWGGRQEKWIRAADNRWYFLLSNGELRVWDRTSNATGDFVANVGAYFYDNPEQLVDAQPGAAGLGTLKLQSTGANSADLVIDIRGGFRGRFEVTVRVFDARGDSDEERFFVLA